MLVLATDTAFTAWIGAGAAILAALITVGAPVLVKRWRSRDRNVLREKREAAGNGWQETAARMTAELSTISAGIGRLDAVSDLYARLQGESEQLKSAFGRDSVLVCVERHIRAIMRCARDIAAEADRANKAADLDRAHRLWEQLSNLNSAGIDVAIWNVFVPEFAAWQEGNDRDLKTPASPERARKELRELVLQHCRPPNGDLPNCDLLPAPPES